MNKKQVCILLCMAMFASKSWAGTLENIENAMSKTKTFEADFVQEANNKELGMKNESVGRIFLKKEPSNVRWNYTSPDKLIFLITDDFFTYYSEEDNQVIKRKSSENAVLQTPLFLLSGKGEISEKFNIEKVVHDAQKKLLGLLLLPKEESESYQKIILGVDDKNYIIQKISIIDIAGNVTSVTFSNQKINKALPSNIFTFKVPDGAEVITDKDLPPS